MDKLAEIIAYKTQEIEPIIPTTAKLKAAALQRNEFKGFRSALDRGPDKLGVIAEIKKASPSAGIIDPNFDPIRQAGRYVEGGASCMSVLTDVHFFQGSLSYLTKIAQEFPIPTLRKDFIIHEAQIYEAVIAGADAVLLIVAGLEKDKLKRLYQISKDLQLDVLVEVHNLPEMETAIDLGADMIGVNNRDLKKFTTDLTITESLADEVGDDILLVSESGIKNVNDAQQVLDYGANAVLVGETLMRLDIPQDEIQAYLSLQMNLQDEKSIEI